MENKPHFGPRTSAANKEKVNKEVQSEPIAEAEQEVKIGVHDNQGRKKNGSFHWFIEIFKLQSRSFWITNYLLSLLAVFFYAGMVPLWSVPLDFIFYPITVTILGETVKMMGLKENILYSLIVGTNGSVFLSGSGFGVIVYWLLWLFFFSIRFGLSFILGIIGLAYMLVQAKKMDL
ncbi:hypothetical protein [Furfurilactobacillus rossiae]|uniref:Uncharacterized protein n=1 Tax=Furfurilactobacillus rossiae DSM 15814 TaxID=1114972 RepID=A0A0R1RSZ9_9LACO|nr:hypothetical protein [Furfurilactobacillus rossiae]KRL56395.1 hypothetical protein FD35_GL002031 [Furfurilactobacillus rossiae DSM 15814]QFR67902.1 hypothetical protein LR814_12705 [Furfurilactobacillus rossiae]QLE60887.1 hypothetical protein LROSRS0_0840 [Furfurilactobacillus rossiae]